MKLAAAALRGVSLKTSDFEGVMEGAGPGDAVFCDPTYTVAHDNNGFVRYNERNFSWNDQQRLAGAAFRAAERGSVVVLTNANHECVRELYRGAHTEVRSREGRVARSAALRRRVEELLITIEPRR